MRPIFSSVDAPVLVLNSGHDRYISIDEAHYLADNLPNGRLKVLDRDDHYPWIKDVDEIDSVARQSENGPSNDRILATILITDIVGSTATAIRIRRIVR